MRESRSALVELTRARLIEFVRDPGALFWVFGFPLLLAAGLGIAFRNQGPEPVRVAVVAPGDSGTMLALSRPGFEVKPASAEDAALMLTRAQVDLVAEPIGDTISYRFDETRPESRYARLAVDEALQRARGRTDVAKISETHVTEPGSRYIDFLLPGLIGLNLLGSSVWGLGYSIVDARKRKLLKRLAATPMRRRDYLLALLISRLLFLVIEVVALVFIGELLFGVHVQGSYAAVMAVCLAGGFAFTGISLLIAARTQSTETAQGLLNFVTMPMWLLSGTFFSAARFPEWLQPIVQALPLTAMNDALRAVVNEGQSLASQSLELVGLMAWGLVTFVVALKIFRWQ
jgi:ABC-type multidrug transport system permease subunit